MNLFRRYFLNLEKNEKSKFKKIIWFLTSSIFFVYLNSIFNPFIWDDFSLIYENPFIKSFKFLLHFFNTDIFLSASNFYRPIQMFFYALVYRIFKDNPIGYHLLNILFHSGCAILVYLLLRKIYGERVSFLVALVWGIHPINTEAITYISGTADPLFLFFGLLGI
ncbi:MAG: hypothetical protein N2589_06250, partial [bacterium]|nr:hypothetical protein [bacterium]